MGTNPVIFPHTSWVNIPINMTRLGLMLKVEEEEGKLEPSQPNLCLSSYSPVQHLIGHYSSNENAQQMEGLGESDQNSSGADQVKVSDDGSNLPGVHEIVTGNKSIVLHDHVLSIRIGTIEIIPTLFCVLKDHTNVQSIASWWVSDGEEITLVLVSN